MNSQERLHEALLRGLRSGEWRPGHRLPTERQLSERYGIGRSAVRRVLARLKAQGLVRQTVGSGTYAHDVSGVEDSQRAAHISPSELMEARLVLEPAIVELVVRNATEADFVRMDRCCEEAEAAKTLEQFEHWDCELHEAIAQAAHNSLVLELFRSMGRARSEAEWGELKRRSVTAERRLHYQGEHRTIVSALRERHLELAMDCTRRHLVHVRQNLLGY